eukprot:747471-Hanusia_phi.AAC.3
MAVSNIQPRPQENYQAACFFSLHLVDGKTGCIMEESFYTSTMCRKTSNPAWTDIDHEEMLIRIDVGALENSIESGKFAIRVWNCLCRPLADRSYSSDMLQGMRRPMPKPAPWSHFSWRMEGALMGKQCDDGQQVSSERSCDAHVEIIETRLLFENVVDTRRWVRLESSLNEVRRFILV